MDSSAAQMAHENHLKTSDAWEDNEESELDTEDEMVMEPSVNRARPRFADMRSEGSWSAMSDKDPMQAFRKLVGSLLEASPGTSPAGHQTRERNVSALSATSNIEKPPVTIPDAPSNNRRSRGFASPRLSKLLRAGLLQTPTGGDNRASLRIQHRRDSTLQAFQKLAGSLLLTPRKSSRNFGGKSPSRNFSQSSAFQYRPFLSPRQSRISGRSSNRRKSGRHSTAKALRQIADALLLVSPSSRRTSMRSTYLATPSSGAHHGRDESRELYDAIIGAIVRLKTQTPVSKINTKRGKKKLKLVWVDEEEAITKIQLPNKPPCSQKKFSELSDLSDDEDLESVLPVGNPNHGDEQKPSDPMKESGRLLRARSRLGSIVSDDEEPSVLPLKKPRLSEQKLSSGAGPRQRDGHKSMDTAGLGSRDLQRSLTPQRDLHGYRNATLRGAGGPRVSRKTVRVIDMGGKSMIERNSTAGSRSTGRLGDLSESRSPSPAPSATPSISRRSHRGTSTMGSEDANLLLRLIDLHSKQIGLTSERAEHHTEEEMDDDEILVMRLSQFSACSARTSKTRSKTRSASKRPLRRQHSDLGITGESARRASRRRATVPARCGSDPNLRLRPLIDPKTKQANCSIM